jgi:copper resistance protein C
MQRPSLRAGRRLVAALAILAALAAAPLAVQAHAELTASDPKAGSTVTGSPEAITLDFSDTLKSNSHFEVTDASGAQVLKGGPDPAKGDRMSVAVATPLAAGAYQVQWTSVASDGDVERGKFSFTVAQATPAPATPTASAATSASTSPSTTPTASPSATAAPSPSSDGSQTGGSGGSDVVLPILVALILVGGVGIWLARRQRRA